MLPVMGSSPRVRGEDLSEHELFDDAGIIPAGAGRSPAEGKDRDLPWDHPRGCGEKDIFYFSDRLGKGSSPRVRGEASNGALMTGAFGIIPAGAGRRVSVSPVTS